MMMPEDILGFWFQDSLANNAGLDRHFARWFGRNASFDRLIEERFGADIERTGRGEMDEWAERPHGRLALILLLDQFPRNAFRDTAKAYRFDARAAALSAAGIAVGADKAIAPLERLFFYLPLFHAERLDLQQQSVACFERLLAETPRGEAPDLTLWVRRAHRQRTIIRCFGRFPHRNRVLGRSPSMPETLFMAARALCGRTYSPHFNRGRAGAGAAG